MCTEHVTRYTWYIHVMYICICMYIYIYLIYIFFCYIYIISYGSFNTIRYNLIYFSLRPQGNTFMFMNR